MMKIYLTISIKFIFLKISTQVVWLFKLQYFAQTDFSKDPDYSWNDHTEIWGVYFSKSFKNKYSLKIWALDDLSWFILTFFRMNLGFFDHKLLINIGVSAALLSSEFLDKFYYNSFLGLLILLKNESKLSPNEVSRFALTFSFSQSKALKKCVTQVSTNDTASQKINSFKKLWTFFVGEISFYRRNFRRTTFQVEK